MDTAQAPVSLWQIFAALSAAVASIAALITAWLNYRARPLAVRAIELHSRQFQDQILPDWLKYLPNTPAIGGYGPYRVSYSLHPTLRDIIKLPLYQDLRNHMPQGSVLMPLWDNYPKNWEELEKEIVSLQSKVASFISTSSNQAGLKGVGEPNEALFNEAFFIRRYYEALIDLAQGSSKLLDTLKEHAMALKITVVDRGFLIYERATPWASIRDEAMAEKALELLRSLVNALPQAKNEDDDRTLLADAQRLVAHSAKLNETRETISSELTRLMALPLLPNASCPLLKIANPSVLPGWLAELLGSFRFRTTFNANPKQDETNETSPRGWGMSLFTLSLTLLAIGLNSWATGLLFVLALSISVYFCAATFPPRYLLKPFRLDKPYGPPLKTLLFAAYLVTYLYSLFDATKALTGIMLHVILYFGLFWILVIIIAQASEISRTRRLLGLVWPAIFFIFSAQAFQSGQLEAAIIELASGTVILVKCFNQKCIA